MVWSSGSADPASTTPARATAKPRRRGRGLVVAGTVLAVLGLVVAVVSAVEVAAGVGRPLTQTLTNPILRTPLDTRLELTEGRYTVFELTGHRSGAGGVQFTQDDVPDLAPDAVIVIGPDGRQVGTSAAGNDSETVDRGNAIFTAAVSFVAPSAGDYQVKVLSPESTQLIIAPSVGFGFGRVWGWLISGAAGGLVLVVGLTLLIVGLFRGRRPHPGPAAGSQPSVTPPPGWYPDPRQPGRFRYWNGRDWTADVR